MLKIVSKVFQVLSYVDIVFFLALAVLLLTNFKKLGETLKVFSLFLSVAFVIILVSLVLAKLSIPNTLYYHILYFVQVIWFAVFYYMALSEWKFRKVILYAAGAFLVFSVWKYLTDWAEIGSIIGGVYYFISTLLFVAFAVTFYVLVLINKVQPKFQLINAAVLIYYSCTSVIFLFSKYYYKEGFEGQMILWVLNVVLHILFLLLIFVEVWRMLYPHPKV